MFSQSPDEEYNKNKNNSRRSQQRQKPKTLPRKRKNGGLKKQFAKQKHSRFANTMSAWFEQYTTVTSWQIKHELAYWKSRALALEFENGILHQYIKKNYIKSRNDIYETDHKNKENDEDQSEESDNDSNAESDDEESEENNDDQTEENSDSESDEGNNDQRDGSDFEVSEEYIQFLKSNVKFKEDARKERERLRKMNDTQAQAVEDLEAGPSGIIENKEESLKMLYGKHWQRINALETSLQSQFISECDIEKPMHWPNIPFNFRDN